MFDCRLEILGVFNHRNVQLAFYDTPGFVRFDDALKDDAKIFRAMASTAAEKADVVLITVDATQRLTKVYQDTFAEMV